MFSNELRPHETLAGALDAMVAEKVNEYKREEKQAQRELQAAQAAAKPFLDILDVLGVWLAENDNLKGIVKLPLQVRMDGKNYDILFTWVRDFPLWEVSFPGRDKCFSVSELDAKQLRFLAYVNVWQLARSVADWAIAFNCAPPRFVPQDSSPQDAPHGD